MKKVTLPALGCDQVESRGFINCLFTPLSVSSLHSTPLSVYFRPRRGA